MLRITPLRRRVSVIIYVLTFLFFFFYYVLTIYYRIGIYRLKIRYWDCFNFTFLYLAWSSWHHNALLRNLYKNIVELSCPVRWVASERGMLPKQEEGKNEKGGGGNIEIIQGKLKKKKKIQEKKSRVECYSTEKFIQIKRLTKWKSYLYVREIIFLFK